jgi:hypothetical protein
VIQRRYVDDHTREQAFISAVTAEHFASQAARSAIIAELTARAMVYMGAVSSALITFGFVAQAADLTPFIATVLPALFLLGEFTFAAMLRNSMESVVLLRQIQRIRNYYRELGPDARKLFDPPASDRQFDAAIATFGLRPPPLQLFFTGASTIAAVNAILGGVGIALLCVQLDLPVAAAVAVGIPVAVILFGAHVLYQQRRFAWLNRSSGHLAVAAEETAPNT